MYAVPANSASVDNYSATQASSGLSLLPTQLPALSSSSFAPSFTPGYVNAPFGTPYAVPFSSPELARQYAVTGPAMRPIAQMQPSNLPPTNAFECQMITIDGLEKGQGCMVRKGSEATKTIDLSGTTNFMFVNGANRMTVVGDPQAQMCSVSYTDAFDTASFLLDANKTFNVCI